MTTLDYNKIIENESELNFYKDTHEKILLDLKYNGPTTFWNIVRNIQGSDRRVLRLINEMTSLGEINLNGREISLKNQERTYNNVVCNSCHGKGIQIKNKYLEILSIMKEIYSKKPAPTFLFDQRPVTSETTVRRAEYLEISGDLIAKKIAIIGDDDLTSIAIGLTKKAEEIVVFDIDKRLISFINKVSKEFNLNIKAYQIDLTKDIPNNFSNYFDVFLTDPTPNPEAFSLFISIGLHLLKEKEGCVGYVSFFPSHQNKSIEFQRILTDKKVIITDIIPKFTEYEFISETYRKEDLELLRKFDSGEKRLSFHENITRFETTNTTIKAIKELNENERKSIFGKATKNIINNLEKDPAFIHGDKEFVEALAENMKGDLQ
jgi:hypothetical protein